jgi:predicted DNA-binding transcriptional regulator YafY
MAPRLSRLERMTNLVLALLETPRPLSLREIGQVVAGYPAEPGALRQAFERDKRTLRDGGIPVAVERIAGDDQVGYTIVPEEYYLPDLGLSSAETEALALALAAVRLEGRSGTDVADKLGARRADVPPLAVLPALEPLGPLHEALRRRAVARFAYRGRTREVEGDALVFSRGAWYFHGADRTTDPPGGTRTFRVDRIESAIELAGEAAYEPRPAPARVEAASVADRAIEALVAVDRRHAASVVELAGPGAVRAHHDDGSVIVAIPVTDEAAFCSFVFGLGHAAVVLEPPELRAAVIEHLELLAAR